MSMQIQNSGQSNINNIEELYSSTLQALNQSLQKLQAEGLPKANSASASAKSDVPELPAPSHHGLSLETLIDALGFEQRKTNCQAGLTSLEAKAAEQKEVNEKNLEELGKQIDKMKQQKVLNVFKKIFSAIGAVIGAIAAAATIAVGVMTGNPLLIAAGAIGAVMAVDSIISLASNGEASLMKGFTELGKACGMSDEAAGYFAMAMYGAMALTSIALSLGAGFSNAASSTAKLADGAAKLSGSLNTLNNVQKGLNITNSVISIGTGATTIAGSVVEYQVNTSKASQKELEAILERIRQSAEMEKDLVESEMQRSNDLLGKVKDIVDNSNATQTAILTGSPSFA